MKPTCFDSEEQFAGWLALDNTVSNYRSTANVCKDCTPSYASAMRLQGRCEHPEVKVLNPYTLTDEDPQKARRGRPVTRIIMEKV